jgi:hypothetical protein
VFFFFFFFFCFCCFFFFVLDFCGFFLLFFARVRRDGPCRVNFGVEFEDVAADSMYDSPGFECGAFFCFFFCRAEVTALLRLSEPGHPNIIKLYTVLEDADNMYMILEYASHGELFDYIVENSPLGTCFFSLIMRCLAAPLVFFFFFLAFSFFFFFFCFAGVRLCVTRFFCFFCFFAGMCFGGVAALFLGIAGADVDIWMCGVGGIRMVFKTSILRWC